MKQRHIIGHYFTGYADWALKGLEYRKPFGECYNIVAPTAVIQEVNNELNRLAKSIYQPERIKQFS